MCNVTMLGQWDLCNITVKICHTAIVLFVNDSIYDPHQNPKSKARGDTPTLAAEVISIQTSDVGSN